MQSPDPIEQRRADTTRREEFQREQWRREAVVIAGVSLLAAAICGLFMFLWHMWKGG